MSRWDSAIDRKRRARTIHISERLDAVPCCIRSASGLPSKRAVSAARSVVQARLAEQQAPAHSLRCRRYRQCDISASRRRACESADPFPREIVQPPLQTFGGQVGHRNVAERGNDMGVGMRALVLADNFALRFKMSEVEVSRRRRPSVDQRPDHARER